MYRVVTNEHARVGSWIEANGGGFYREGAKCIGLERDGVLVAGTLNDYHNGASIYTHIAAKVITREFLRVLFHYPFVQLRVKVMIGLVAASNWKARRFVEHLGFQLVAPIPEGHPEGSLLIYTMRSQDCRWLRSKHEAFTTARS